MKFRAFFPALAIVLAAAAPARAQLWMGKPGDISELEKEAAAGDAGKTAEFAWHLLEGEGGRRFDPGQIFKLFESAAAQGSALGQVGLSRCYSKGIGTSVDLKRAWQLAEQAATVSHPEGWKQKGYLLAQGLGVEPDLEEGQALTAKAAEAGSVAAQVNHMIHTGYRGYPDRYSPQIELALRTGNLMAALNGAWGYVFSREDPGQHERNRKLIELLESRAKLEHPDALRALAFIRRCQGDIDGEGELLVRAARTGILNGVEDLVKNLNLPENPKQGRKVAPFFASQADRNALNWQAYQLGDRDESAIFLAFLALNEGFPGHAADPAAAGKLLAKHLPGRKKGFHFTLANLYSKLPDKEGKGKPGRLAVAHATYCVNEDPRAMGLIGYLLSGEVASIPADPVRAHAAISRAPANDRFKALQGSLEKKLTPEQKKESEALVAEGYPDAPEFLEAAMRELEDAGELKGGRE